MVCKTWQSWYQQIFLSTRILNRSWQKVKPSMKMIREKSHNALLLMIWYVTFLANFSLRLIGSRLYVIQGKPEEQIPLLVAKWGVELLTFEKDTEPYAVLRDTSITKALAKGVKVSSVCSHTLYETEHYLATNGGKIPTTYVAFCKLFLSMSSMRQPIETITSIQVTIEWSRVCGHCISQHS